MAQQMAAAAADIRDGAGAAEVVRGEDASQLRVSLGRHRLVEDAVRFGVARQLTPRAGFEHVLAGRLSRANGVFDLADHRPHHREAEHPRHRAHRLRVIGAQQA
jgi:hypothetical protein